MVVCCPPWATSEKLIIRQVERERISHARVVSILTGVRRLHINWKRTVPCNIQISRKLYRAYYRGQPQTCFRCTGTDHTLALDCPRARSRDTQQTTIRPSAPRTHIYTASTFTSARTGPYPVTYSQLFPSKNPFNQEYGVRHCQLFSGSGLQFLSSAIFFSSYAYCFYQAAQSSLYKYALHSESICKICW